MKLKWKMFPPAPILAVCRETSSANFTRTQNHGTGWVERDLEGHPVPLPAMERDTFHYSSLVQGRSNLALDTSRDRAECVCSGQDSARGLSAVSPCPWKGCPSALSQLSRGRPVAPFTRALAGVWPRALPGAQARRHERFERLFFLREPGEKW